MSINIADNFSYLGTKPLDGRIKYATVALMKTQAESTLYDGCLAYVDEDGKMYQYKSSNTVDSTTGRWREYSTGSTYTAGTGIAILGDILKSNLVYSTTLSTDDNEYPNNYIRIVLVSSVNGKVTFLGGIGSYRYLIKINNDEANKAYPFMNLELIKLNGNNSANSQSIVDCIYRYSASNTIEVLLKVRATSSPLFTLTELSVSSNSQNITITNLGNDSETYAVYHNSLGAYFESVVSGQVADAYQGITTVFQTQKLTDPLTINGATQNYVESALSALNTGKLDTNKISTTLASQIGNDHVPGQSTVVTFLAQFPYNFQHDSSFWNAYKNDYNTLGGDFYKLNMECKVKTALSANNTYQSAKLILYGDIRDLVETFEYPRIQWLNVFITSDGSFGQILTNYQWDSYDFTNHTFDVMINTLGQSLETNRNLVVRGIGKVIED